MAVAVTGLGIHLVLACVASTAQASVDFLFEQHLQPSVALTFVVRGSGNLMEAAPGFVYWLIGPAMIWHHRRFHALRKTLPPRLF